MEVVATTAVIGRANISRQILTVTVPTPNFSQARCHSCEQTDDVEALKGKFTP